MRGVNLVHDSRTADLMIGGVTVGGMRPGLTAILFVFRLTASRRRLLKADTVACGLPLNNVAGSMLKYEQYCR